MPNESIKASVGMHNKGTTNCYNLPPDVAKIIRLLNWLSFSDGGMVLTQLNPSASAQDLYKAILHFQQVQNDSMSTPRLSVDGHVDPGGNTLARLNMLAEPARPPDVPKPLLPTEFHPGVNHTHVPSGRYSQVQANPNTSNLILNGLCRTLKTPEELVGAAILAVLMDKPIARAHLEWYLRFGKGRDFVEDANIKDMLSRDDFVQVAIRGRIQRIPSNQQHGKVAKHMEVFVNDFSVPDFSFTYGTIDRMDFEVDFDAGTVHVWFQDRYEWHPVYPGLYTLMPGDIVRPTNCLHAALVELKSSGAVDFWMKGEATVPLEVIGF
jgi:hypothetical protein